MSSIYLVHDSPASPLLPRTPCKANSSTSAYILFRLSLSLTAATSASSPGRPADTRPCFNTLASFKFDTRRPASIFLKLNTLPRENISPWKESPEAAALAYCTSHSPDGTLGLACDAASWHARHAGAVVPRPACPDPDILADPATPAQR
jgi:hypothetical protein